MEITVPPLSSMAILFHLFVGVMFMTEFKRWPVAPMYQHLMNGSSRLQNVWRIANISLATMQLATVLFDSILFVLFSPFTVVSNFVKYFVIGEMALSLLLSSAFLVIGFHSRKMNPKISELAKYFAFTEFLLVIVLGAIVGTLFVMVG
jgi:hypothetical protein